MLFLNTDWNSFFETLPIWDRASRRVRSAFLTEALNSRRRGDRPRDARDGPAASRFESAIFAMGLVPLHDYRCPEALLAYLMLNLSEREIKAFARAAGLEDASVAGVAREIDGPSLAADFLGTDTVFGWQEQLLVGAERMPLVTASELRAAKRLVEGLMDCPEPVPFTRLADLVPGETPRRLGAAVGACVRFLLAFPALRLSDLSPVLGLSPSAHESFHGPVSAAPKPPETHHVFACPLLTADMTTVLAALSAAPLRAGGYGATLHKRHEEKLVSLLASIPRWIEDKLGLTRTRRLESALEAGFAAGFLVRSQVAGTSHLVTTGEGRRWLGLSPKGRLAEVLDRCDLLALLALNASSSGRRLASALFGAGERSAAPLSSDVVQALRALEAHGDSPPVSVDDLARAHIAAANPFRARSRRSPRIRLINRPPWGIPALGSLTASWTKQLSRLLLPLVHLGCARVGLRGDGEPVVALTGAGMYLLGAAEEFDFTLAPAGRIVVEIDFGIVFFTESPAAQAEIGRFAERRRQGLGRLYEVTRAAAHAGAAGGMDGRGALAVLEEVTGGDVPENVRFALREWFERCRLVEARGGRARCPDPETAARLAAVTGCAVSPSGGSVVELGGAISDKRIRRKLLSEGIVVALGVE